MKYRYHDKQRSQVKEELTMGRYSCNDLKMIRSGISFKISQSIYQY